MEKSNRSKLIVTFVILIMLIAGLYFFTDWFSRVTGYLFGEAEIEELSLCLTQNGAEFYTSETCVDCERQLNLFGKFASSVKVIDCGASKENCPNIQSLPAWYINKKIYYGYKSLEELEELSSCGK